MKARFSLFEGTWRKYHGLQGADAFWMMLFQLLKM